MAGVTDTAFRQMICKYGRQHAVFTEFMPCDSLYSPDRNLLLVDLKYHASGRPVVAQVFRRRPKTVFKTAELVRELGFDGIDINTRRPDRNVVTQGAGAGLIRNPTLMTEIIKVC